MILLKKDDYEFVLNASGTVLTIYPSLFVIWLFHKFEFKETRNLCTQKKKKKEKERKKERKKDKQN